MRTLRPCERRRAAPARGLQTLLGLVRADHCDVAVGSRFVSGDGYEPFRYRQDRVRRLGTGVLRRAMQVVLRQPFGDATSGLCMIGEALPILAKPFDGGAESRR